MYVNDFIFKCKMLDNLLSELSISLKIIIPLIYCVKLQVWNIYVVKIILTWMLLLIYKEKMSILKIITMFITNLITFLPIKWDNFKLNMNPNNHPPTYPNRTLPIPQDPFNVGSWEDAFNTTLPATITQREVFIANRALHHIDRSSPQEKARLGNQMLDVLRGRSAIGSSHTEFTPLQIATLKFFMRDKGLESGISNAYTLASAGYAGLVRQGDFRLEGNNTLEVQGSLRNRTLFMRTFSQSVSDFKSANNVN